MEPFFHTFEHIFPMIPVLFLTYLILETIEAKQIQPIILKQSLLSPIIASGTSLIPHCGIPSLFANFYAAGLISLGTLLASFISCSDDMLPIMISTNVPLKEILSILFIKWIAGTGFGMLFHVVVKPKQTDIESLCHEENCGCSSGIWKSAAIHTVKITWTLFLVTLVLEIIMHDAEHLLSAVTMLPSFIQIIFSAFIGLIPSCASSIFLTQLYVNDLLTFSALIAGLCANAGTGLLVLFRVNPEKKDTLRILVLLILSSLTSGIIVSFF